MSPGGGLFLGHSESMAGMNLQLKALTSSVYGPKED
jgi:chemotaxis methyl-accepting protein methylase